jgi:hypothetical protein
MVVSFLGLVDLAALREDGSLPLAEVKDMPFVVVEQQIFSLLLIV